jgi:hypothetical protein
MSATLTKPKTASTASRKGDAWLGKLGIGVARMRNNAAPAMPPLPLAPGVMPPLPPVPGAAAMPPLPPTPRVMPPLPPLPVPPGPPARPTQAPGEAAYRAALAAAQPVIDGAEASLASPPRGSEAVKVRAPYDVASAALATAEAKRDFLAAAELLKTKAAAAAVVDAAGTYDKGSFHSRFRTNIRKADITLAQSGVLKGAETVTAAFLDGKKQLDAALAQRDYVTASDILGDVSVKANAAYAPYETLLLAERNKPLFEQAEKLFRQKKLPPHVVQMKKEYEQFAKDQDNGRKTEDYELMRYGLNNRIDKAKKVVALSQNAAVDAWFDGNQAAPAAGSGGGIATNLATMPDFATMDEKAKFDVMANVFREKPEELEERVRQKYAKALADGVKMDLSPAQMAAAIGYSGSNYDRMNGLLRGSLDTTKLAPDELDRAKVQIALLEEALANLPPLDPAGFPLFRWETPYGNYLQTRYQEGATFEIKEFWSTGAGGGSAVGSVNTEILVWGKKQCGAKDISRLSLFDGTEGSRADGGKLKGQAGGEVLFPPGTKFKTLKFNVFDKDNKEVLERVDSKNANEVDIHYRVEIVEL